MSQVKWKAAIFAIAAISLIGILILILDGANRERARNETQSLEEVETISISGSYIGYYSEGGLYQSADLVVIARTDKSFEEREHIVRYMDDLEPKALEEFYSRTPITIQEVIKKPTDSTIIKNDTINLIEPVVLMKDNNRVQKLTTENYLEIKEHHMYLLYLKETRNGNFSVINMSSGRFNLEQEEEIDGDYEMAKHKMLKPRVLSKYQSLIEELKLGQ